MFLTKYDSFVAEETVHGEVKSKMQQSVKKMRIAYICSSDDKSDLSHISHLRDKCVSESRLRTKRVRFKNQN